MAATEWVEIIEPRTKVDIINLSATDLSRDEDLIFFSRILLSWRKKSDPDPTLIRNEKKYLYILMKKNIYIIVTAVHQ